MGVTSYQVRGTRLRTITWSRNENANYSYRIEIYGGAPVGSDPGGVFMKYSVGKGREKTKPERFHIVMSFNTLRKSMRSNEIKKVQGFLQI